MEGANVLPQAAILSRSPLRNVSGNESLTNSAKRFKRVPVESPVVPTQTPIDSSKEAALPLESIECPSNVPFPSKGLVKSLVDHAMTNDKSDQAALADVGVLSFEEVLLPAIASSELQALKDLQAKVQRDLPHQTDMVVRCRKTVMASIGAAMQAVSASREKRDAQRREELQQEKEKELKRQEVEKARSEEVRERELEIARNKQKQELIKKLPKNQELWREIVYLMTEISKLQKEEKSWKDAAEHLNQQEREIEEMERQHKEDQEKQSKQTVDTPKEVTITEEIEKVNQTLEDISLSCIRIHQALENVSKIAEESDRVRLQLHKQYRRNHQFQGYQGIKDPKGLIMSLSQSQTWSQSDD
ncbi:hypothetical protein FisN_3Lh467 [Fistulifera solaris]|uniref:Uncharacterized protein n=1 Tax=Fistulifera solaris TaxID=1519565 RepID=A0A1Z5J8F1_FISSO|nr:hypothetical protein FisN_3Lh467 [Fistulifera solaris]|eukprot:GAX10265.1 hypothetical protein FisN_3Lh467 [Fistulifera solaris]